MYLLIRLFLKFHGRNQELFTDFLLPWRTFFEQILDKFVLHRRQLLRFISYSVLWWYIRLSISSFSSAHWLHDINHGRHSTRSTSHSSNSIVYVGAYGIHLLSWGSHLFQFFLGCYLMCSDGFRRKSFDLQDTIIIFLFTESSLVGYWGWEGGTHQGLRLGNQFEEHINLWEMKAVLLHCLAVIQGHSLMVASDYSIA